MSVNAMNTDLNYTIAQTIFEVAFDSFDSLYFCDEIEIDGVMYYVDVNSDRGEFYVGRVRDGYDEELPLSDELEIERQVYNLMDEWQGDTLHIAATNRMLGYIM